MTMGVLVSTGATREASKVLGGYQVAEPVELVRIPTYQVMGVIAIRARRAISSRLRGIRRRLRPGRRPKG